MSTSTMESTTKPAKKGWNMKIWGPLIVISIVGGTVGGVMGGIFGNPARPVLGIWKTNFGTYVSITGTKMCSVSGWGKGCNDVKKFAGGYFITQNSATDAYNPSKFVKNEYHTIPTGWAYCMSKYDAATLAEAEGFDTTTIYKKDDQKAGCNGFGHTQMTKHADQKCDGSADVLKCLTDLKAADAAGR
jgi:hypothetical protein